MLDKLRALFSAPLSDGVRRPTSAPGGIEAIGRESWHYNTPVTGTTPPLDPTVPVDYSDTHTSAGVGNRWIQENGAVLPHQVGVVGIRYPDYAGVPSNLNENDIGHVQQTSAVTGHQRQPIMRGPVTGGDVGFSNLRAQLLSPTVGTSGPVSGGDGGGTSAQAFFASQQALLNDLAVKTALAYAS